MYLVLLEKYLIKKSSAMREIKFMSSKPSPDRFLCFFYDGAKIIITNAYVKKIAKMPIKEKKKALKSKADYMKRYKGGTYYE